MNKGYNDLSVTPPDEMVKVIDEEGVIGYAFPTYYPFKVGESVNGKKWSSPVIACEPYWDGGWLIQCKDLEIPQINNIVGWKIIPK
jgi:hypothetical protein